MALGGTFITTNKVLPGGYINFVSKNRALGSIGERGTVAMFWNGDFGKTGEVVTITLDDFQKNSISILGHSYDDDYLLPFREVFKGANTIKFFRPSGGTKATNKIGNLTVTARYEGTRGNNLKIAIYNNIDDDSFIVETFLDNILKDSQIVSSISQLSSNDFVSFDGSGTFTTTSGISLSGGTNSQSVGQSYSNFLEAIEKEDFTTILYAGSDLVTQSLFAEFTKRLRDEEGYKITCVLRNYTADFEGVINLDTKCKANQKITENDLVYWVAGKVASANINESLTNAIYDGELNPITAYSKSELTQAIQNGKFVFYDDKGKYRVLKDVNSFTSVTAQKNNDFKNNQIIRVLDAIGNDIANIFNTYYLGKCQNSETGRDILKTEIVNYHEKLLAMGAIDNFSPENITVSKGENKGEVIVSEFVEPVGAMDIMYMKCVVE